MLNRIFSSISSLTVVVFSTAMVSYKLQHRMKDTLPKLLSRPATSWRDIRRSAGEQKVRMQWSPPSPRRDLTGYSKSGKLEFRNLTLELRGAGKNSE